MIGWEKIMKAFVNRLKLRIKKKLLSNQGDSIAEVLIALLISSLALVMLASMITSSSRMIISSKTKLTDYYSVDRTHPANGGDSDSVTFEIYGQTHTYKVKYSKDEAFSVISYEKAS